MSEQSKRTSEILDDIINLQPTGGKISVKEFITKLSDRAFGLCILIFCLITAFIPGASLIFSIPVFTIAVQMILGQHVIWVPKWLAKKSFRESIIDSALRKVIPTLKVIEKFIRPRFTALTSSRGEKFIAVLIILLNILVVPPIPGLNMIPSLCMCFLALSLLENDGALAALSIFASMLVLIFYYGVITLVLISIFNGSAELSFDTLFKQIDKKVEEMHHQIQ